MFSDWTILKSNPLDIECGITSITPFVGSGSLRIKDNSTTNLNMYSNLYTQGLTRGRMRMLIRITSQGGTVGYRTGFYFNTDTVNLTTGITQNFYSAHIRLTPATNTRQYVLSHFSGGLGGTGTPFFVSSNISPMTNGVSVIPLEIEWQTEPELAGVKMILRGSITASTLTTFANLTPLATLIVANPVYVLNTSIGEGIYYYGSTSPGGSELEYDQVSIYKQTPI